MSRSALLYTALGAGAILLAGLAVMNGRQDASQDAPATEPTASASAPLAAPPAAAELRNLAFHSAPKPVPAIAYATPEGEGQLSDFNGKIAVVNFWATWCPPCRKEMPSLDALAAGAQEDLAVVTIATSRTNAAQAAAFFDDIGATHLPRYTDTNGELARAMGVMGLPVTVILNRDGNEIARLSGEADWNSDTVKAVLAELIAQ